MKKKQAKIKDWREPFRHGDIVYDEPDGLIICGDCLDVLPKFPIDSIDMLYTDPPYGLGGYAGRSGTFDKMIGDDKDAICFYSILSNVPERYFWGNHYVLARLQNTPRDVIIWVKNRFGMGRGYRGQYEMCFYYGAFDGSDSDIWMCPLDNTYWHPTQKPVALAIRAMRNSSDEGDIILDAFLGSGSTAIAAVQLNRRFIGIEISKEYCELAVQRIHHAKLSQRFDVGKFNKSKKGKLKAAFTRLQKKRINR